MGADGELQRDGAAHPLARLDLAALDFLGDLSHVGALRDSVAAGLFRADVLLLERNHGGDLLGRYLLRRLILDRLLLLDLLRGLDRCLRRRQDIL